MDIQLKVEACLNELFDKRPVDYRTLAEKIVFGELEHFKYFHPKFESVSDAIRVYNEWNESFSDKSDRKLFKNILLKELDSLAHKPSGKLIEFSFDGDFNTYLELTSGFEDYLMGNQPISKKGNIELDLNFFSIFTEEAIAVELDKRMNSIKYQIVKNSVWISNQVVLVHLLRELKKEKWLITNDRKTSKRLFYKDYYMAFKKSYDGLPLVENFSNPPSTATSDLIQDLLKSL